MWLVFICCRLFLSHYEHIPCLSNFTAPMGTVLSPDYPEGYGNNLNCVWLILSEPGSRIHLAFNDFDLEAPYDILTVKDGEMLDSSVLGRFTGAEVPSHLTIQIQKQCLYVSQLKCISVHFTAPCGGHFSAPSGVILSPGWPGYYKDSLNCEWVIEAEPGRSIKITFENIEPNYDFLYIYDGLDSNSPLIGSFQDSKLPERIESSSNTMYLAFRSDGSVSYTGFHLDQDQFYRGCCLKNSSSS
uniref:CUB domain-containing protein n=1 Tax=Sinocyclocheilus grahami TaxID=75366 RepID=A0A672REX2_SINGR